MLETTRHNYRLVAILLSTLGAGIPLWASSKRRIDFTDIEFIVMWTAIGILASFIARFVINLKMRNMVGCFAIGYVIAVVIHFVSSILVNSYVQAQFELSLFIALLTGIFSAWFGALIWTGLRKSGAIKK